jgi:endonuclease III
VRDGKKHPIELVCLRKRRLLGLSETETISFKKSGAIWRRPVSLRKRTVNRVCDTLKAKYGNPRFGNPSDPLDDLIYIILSNKTSPVASRRAYSRLRKRFEEWDDVLGVRSSVLRSLLKPAGLSAVKSRHINRALRIIKNDFGACDLRQLRRMPPEGGWPTL